MTDAATEARARIAKAIYDAIDPTTGDPIATTLHTSEHALYGINDEPVSRQLERVMETCLSAADAILALPALSTPTPAGELREVVETADYLVSLYKRLWLGGVVRDLAEAQGAYEAAKARTLAQPGSGEAV